MGVKYVSLHASPFSEKTLLVKTTFPIGFIVRFGEEVDCSEHFGGVWEKLANESINGKIIYRYKRIR